MINIIGQVRQLVIYLAVFLTLLLFRSTYPVHLKGQVPGSSDRKEYSTYKRTNKNETRVSRISNFIAINHLVLCKLCSYQLWGWCALDEAPFKHYAIKSTTSRNGASCLYKLLVMNCHSAEFSWPIKPLAQLGLTERTKLRKSLLAGANKVGR